MKSSCKAKKFQSRMSHRGSGKAMGEKRVGGGSYGHSAGEVKMGISKMTRDISASKYPHSQSKDGNGGQ